MITVCQHHVSIEFLQAEETVRTHPVWEAHAHGGQSGRSGEEDRSRPAGREYPLPFWPSVTLAWVPSMNSGQLTFLWTGYSDGPDFARPASLSHRSGRMISCP